MRYKNTQQLMTVNAPKNYSILKNWSDIRTADIFAVKQLTKGAKFEMIGTDGVLALIAKLAENIQFKDHTILFCINVHDVNSHTYTDIEYKGVINVPINLYSENLALLPTILDELKGKGPVLLKVFVGMPMFWIKWMSSE